MCKRIKAKIVDNKYKYTNTQIHRVGESEGVIHFIPVLRKISTHMYEFLIHAVRSKHTVHAVRISQSIPSKTASKLGPLGT